MNFFLKKIILLFIFLNLISHKKFIFFTKIYIFTQKYQEKKYQNIKFLQKIIIKKLTFDIKKQRFHKNKNIFTYKISSA